uniref:glutamine--fructose-6-phosphate transaminase (isomerizing) n=1 Tax=viral metagenome TaxID=1070528 RepID=A0A6C0KLR2_9ZZZZ
MCGITLHLCKEGSASFHSIDFVLQSLHELQNRGYDSFGVAYYNQNEKQFKITKKSIHCTQEDTYTAFYNEVSPNRSYICMGHSRWATHGKVNKSNAHPHISNQDLFIVVHNGIIENYTELKDFLKTKGYTFYSETDSEVIVNLIEYFFLHEANSSVKDAIYQATSLLNGTYGLVILFQKQPNIAYVIKQGSPLLISETEEEMMATSELSGFKHCAKQYYEVENNELIVLSRSQGIIFEQSRQKQIKMIDPEFQKKYLTQSVGNYTHYTQKEIMEQDQTLWMSLNQGGRIANNNICLGGLEPMKKILPNIQNIIFIGCGSSYYAGCIGYHYIKCIENLNDLNVFCFDGGDFDKNHIPHGVCLFVFISQSGETMDLIKHMPYIQAHHYTMGIINVIDSAIAKDVDCGIYMNVGKEVAVASTKSFNSSILLLKMFSLWLYQERQNGSSSLSGFELLKSMNDIKDEICLFHNMIYQVKKINHEINIIFEDNNLGPLICEHIFILGKGTMECVAKECALKLKEICYIHGEGMSSASLKHGPLAMIHHHFPVILLINHENSEKMMNTYSELMSRDAYIFVITSEEDIVKTLQQTSNKNQEIILIPRNKCCSEILFMITLQQLCYHLALRKRINPDKPKNLAKVVTVE